MKPAGGIPRSAWGLLVGAGVTALGCAALGLGLFDGLNNYGLDLHFRRLSTIGADPRVVLIDINDHALRAVGDWPWPRRRYAQLVETLGELGAEAIVLDLVLSEPASPRTEHAGLGPHYDVDTELVELGDRAGDAIIFDDDELRDAITEAGNVYLAMFFRLTPPGVDPDTGIDGRIPPYQARMTALLEQDFSLDVSALASAMGKSAPADVRTIEERLPRAKHRVALRAAGRYFADHPAGTFRAFFELMVPGVDFHAITPDREDLIRAYRAQDAFRALADSSPAVPPALSGRVPRASDLTLPVEKLAWAAKGIGFVTFEREASGGVVREIPMVADAEGVLVSQLGLLVATDVLGIDRSSVTCAGRQLLLGSGLGQRHLPLSKEGRTLLNWHVPRGSKRWQDSFDHIPVARVLEIALSDQARVENDRHLGLAMGELVKLRHAETHAIYTQYVRLINRRLALQENRTGVRGISGDPSPAPGTYSADNAGKSERARLDSEIRRIEQDAILWLRRVHGLWASTEPTNDVERAQRDEIRELDAKFGDGQLAERLGTLNDRLVSRSDTLRAELAPRIKGKICLVGYTASGVADLVTSPVYDSMPGVMAHANIINMILQNQPIERGPVWLNVLIMLMGGILITFVTCARGPVFSAASLLVLVGVVGGMGAFSFRSFGYYLASPGVVVQACVVWAFVTAYRQFTEERVRRQFQRALAQYTSPAVAARIAGKANVDDLTPQAARVTCFFSDLYGFTPLSERLGAERTRLVLNPYLRAMSRVLVEHRALINKFMGDGIFAFFNAPIWPCSSHSEAACACALASVEALGELNRQMATSPRGEPHLGDGKPLAMRIGISSGEVFVGDYGSDTKLDYTCIGDTVNLAARLEDANKTFGTTILVDDACRRGAGDRFTFRSLGRIEVVGKALPVEVHELVALAGELAGHHRPG